VKNQVNMPLRRLSIALLTGLLLWVVLLPSAFAGERMPLPADLSEPWQKIKAQNADTGRVAELIAEGDRIILRLQELNDLRSLPKNPDAAGLNQRIEQLQDQFRGLLQQLEMARMAQLPDDELKTMRTRYEQEQQRLMAEVCAIEDSIIERGEQFLATYKQNPYYHQFSSKQEMIVDFLYRLAEIYYRRGEEQFFSSNDIAAFKPALEKYQRIIDEFPASGYVDDALYNIAYIKNSSKSPDDQREAVKFYKTLIEKYAESPFVAEAYWRVGEYYFYQDPPQIENAIQYYSALLEFPDTRWYSRGLYKIGWCHFRGNNYRKAVEYFTQTVENSQDSAASANDLLFASMADEAMEYISVCFATEGAEMGGGGVAAAVAFVNSDSLRRETYGQGILSHLGDIYKFQTGKYVEAIEAYRATLELYPLAKEAPWLQEKIVNCYAINLRDFERAYEAKNILFERYRAGSEWAAANPDSTLHAEADAVIEKYYFENISETIGRALKAAGPAAYTRAVQMSRDYLQYFPQGPNAYTVNFNMAVILDQNLQEPEQAYVEYLKVSRDYPDDRHRKESAVNAAIIAQRLIALQAIPTDSLLNKPSNETEQKYIAAVDNYLNLFPQGEEAEVFLLNAGSIYFNHGLYSDSRKYYEKLLVDFPQGARRGDAYGFLMNGFFAEKNYAQAERVAKEIQTAGFDAELITAAKTRQAESAFLTAEGFKADSNFVQAGDEYKRTALESPDFPQAYKALFEAGLAYQSAGGAPGCGAANEVYLLLVERYAECDLADKALYNAAYNCQSELNDKAAAGSIFERLATHYPESPLAQDALRNASINYVEAKDWAGAIRANSAYIGLFADAPDANLYLFENAGLYLKSGDEAAAEQIYADYSRRYPNDPRTVRAHWERGQYLQEKDRQAEARSEFNSGIQAHRAIISSGNLGEETYASRCLLEVIRAELAAYEAIQLAPAKEVEAIKKTKLSRRDLLMAQLEELNRFAKDEMLEGLYSVGRVEEDLSLAFETQELSSKGSAEEKILERETAYQDAIEIALRTIASYRAAAEQIDQAASVLKWKASELETHQNSLSAWVTNSQKSAPQPPDLPDSTAALADLNHGLQEVKSTMENAQSWSRRAQEKIPELALRNADLKLATVKAFIGLPDAGKTEELKLAYRAAVLAEFAAPRGSEVIRLYNQALLDASASADSNIWRRKALDGIQDLAALLEGEFRALNERALGSYAQILNDYQYLLAQGEGAKTRGLEAADIAERLVFYSGQSAEYANTALTVQSAFLEAAQQGQNIPPELLTTLTASALKEVFRINNRYSALAVEANKLKSEASGNAAQSVVWEDASMTYEDCAYNFTGHRETLLNAALEFNKAHGADQAAALQLAWALVALNRDTYLPLLAQYGQELWVRSDESFRVSREYLPNWEALDCSEKDWVAPRVVQSSSKVGDELASSKAIWWTSPAGAVSEKISSSSDSLAHARESCDSLYLRKVFEISQEPVAGDLWIKVDGGYALQVNGELVGAAEAGQAGEPAHYDIAEFLKSGPNLITIMAVDPDSVNEGVMLALRYKVLPLQTYGGP